MFESFSLFQYGFILLSLILAYVVRGITGFGSGLIAIPLLAFVLPVTFVVPFIGLLDFLGAAGHGFKYKYNVVWKDLLPLLPFSFVGVSSALYLIHTVDANSLKTALAIFILFYGLYSFFAKPFKQKLSRYWSLPTGFIGGLIGTLFGTGGPFYVIYLQIRQLNKQAFRATIAMIFLLDGLVRVIGYYVTDVYQSETYTSVLYSIPIMIIAMIIGGKIHTTLSQDDFKKGISFLLIACGIALLF